MKSFFVLFAVLVVCTVQLTASQPVDYYYDNEAAPADEYTLPLLQRFRREEPPRGNVGVEVGHQRNTDPWGQKTHNTHVRADATYDFYRSRDGNSRLYGNAYAQRNFGDNRSRDAGVGLNFERRF